MKTINLSKKKRFGEIFNENNHMSFHFILDASALEKGLGNIKQWIPCNDSNFLLQLYIPTYTLHELDFQKFKRKSYAARESLKFIDQLEDTSYFQLIIEFPDLVDLITWSEVSQFMKKTDTCLSLLNPRHKNLLKSCIYKCYLEEKENVEWILVTEDPVIRQLAVEFQIPYFSIVEADQLISQKQHKNIYMNNVKFSKYLVKKSIKQIQNEGKEIYKTKFDRMVYAPRGHGELWTP